MRTVLRVHATLVREEAEDQAKKDPTMGAYVVDIAKNAAKILALQDTFIPEDWVTVLAEALEEDSFRLEPLWFKKLVKAGYLTQAKVDAAKELTTKEQSLENWICGIIVEYSQMSDYIARATDEELDEYQRLAQVKLRTWDAKGDE